MDERLDVEGAEHVLGDSVAGVRQHHTSYMAQITRKHLRGPLPARCRSALTSSGMQSAAVAARVAGPDAGCRRRENCATDAGFVRCGNEGTCAAADYGTA